MERFDIKAIKKAMVERGIATQKELVKASGLAPSTISRIFTGKAKPETATALALCKTLGMSRSQLFGEAAAIQSPPTPPMDLSKDVWIEIKGKVWATPFRLSTGRGMGKYIKGKPGQGDCYALEVEGDSMEPMYLAGDVIVCRPMSAKLSPHTDGDDDPTYVPYEHVARFNKCDVVVTHNGETNLKRIVIERKQGPKYDIFMTSMNPKYPRVRVSFGDDWEIQAKVIETIKPEFLE